VANHTAEQTIRDQEVLRATRELAVYFKGGRTEREARAALKIIKAFVRDRERQDPKSRRPLPGTKASPASAARSGAGRVKGGSKTPRRTRRVSPTRVPGAPSPDRIEEFPDRSGADERPD
jgi:hypothetical protein